MQTEKIVEIVRSTRKLSLPNFGNIEAEEKTIGEDKEIVTKIDREIESYLKIELVKIMPDIPFVGEEFGGNRADGKFWLVDPIDGTGHYIRGIPFCTTMLALIDNGQVIFSIIYDFVNDIIYHAELGKGSFKDGEKINVSNRNLKNAYFCCEINSRKEENKSLLFAIRSRANILHTLCAGYEFTLVAMGKIEGRIVYDGFGKDYDFAAGTLLVSEAGGTVRNFHSDKYDYTNLNFIASNNSVYNDLFLGEENIEKYIKQFQKKI